MRKIFLFAFILSGFCINISLSQTDDNGAPYFPLRVGNAFYYRYYHCNPGGCDSAFVISRITQTKIFNGRRYYYVSNLFGRTNSNVYLRYNSSTGYLVYLDTNNANCNYEMAIYNLSANVGDSVSSSCRYGVNFKCKSIVDSSVFGTILRVKKFGYYATSYGWITEAGTHFARQRGCLYDFSATYNNSFAAYQRFLQGCKVNNVVYGDTINHITPSYADSGRYFPLQVGNSFYYKYSRYGMGLPFHIDSGIYVTRITDTSRINGKLYYKLNTFLTNDSVNYFRYDLDSGMLVAYYPYAGCNYEEYFYKLISIPFDSIKTSCLYNNPQRCEGLKDTTVFNLQKKLKTFIYHIESQYAGNYIESFFTKDFGLVHYKNLSVEYHWGHSALAKYDLVGAKINGIIYGDTNTVGLKSINNNVPDKYALYQNYPNPFNPSTIIRFKIPKLSSPHVLSGDLVTLKVYNILGKEVATLVNEKQTPGVYEVTFDGSKYPSGVYFYKLVAGDFTEVKKMLLIK